MDDDLPLTPEGRLLRAVRESVIPKLTIRAAAARVGMSPEQWGYAERGYTPSRGGQSPRMFRPPAATLARMARALGISPEILESQGERPDAAENLRRDIQLGATSVLRPVAAPDDAGSDADHEREIIRLLDAYPRDEVIKAIAGQSRRLKPARVILAEIDAWLTLERRQAEGDERNGTTG